MTLSGSVLVHSGRRPTLFWVSLASTEAELCDTVWTISSNDTDDPITLFSTEALSFTVIEWQYQQIGLQLCVSIWSSNCWGGN